jgi:hypothetical protein
VGDAFRYCPWCAAPQRLKLVEFFRARHGEEKSKALRVSRYLHDELDERHVRFSIWNDARVEAAVSLEDEEAERLAHFLLDSAPSAERRASLRELVDRIAAIRF